VVAVLLKYVQKLTRKIMCLYMNLLESLFSSLPVATSISHLILLEYLIAVRGICRTDDKICNKQHLILTFEMAIHSAWLDGRWKACVSEYRRSYWIPGNLVEEGNATVAK